MPQMFMLPFRPAFDSNNRTLPGAQAYFTLTGTNVKSPAFTTSALTTAHPNPLIADGVGRFPKAYLDPAVSYRVRIYPSRARVGLDTPTEEYDPYIPGSVVVGSELIEPYATSAAASAVNASAAAAQADADAATASGAAQAALFAEAQAEAAAAVVQAVAGEVEFDTAGVNLPIANRGVLAAAPTEIPAYLEEPGREGVFVFDSSDLSAKVAADPLQGLYVAPSSDTTGASGAWVRKYANPVSLPWFGAVADCTAAGSGTSNTAIFDAARAAMVAAGKSWLDIPQRPAAYRFATAPAEIHDKIMLTGEGWSNNPGTVGVTTYVGIQVYNGTVICFDADVPGFNFVAATDNASNAIAYEFQSSVGSSVRDMMLYSPGGVGTTSHGISNYVQLHLTNVRVEGFAGCGVYTAGYESGSSSQYGNTAGSEYNGVYCNSNKLHGFYVEGNNSSAIRFSGCNASGNGGVGYLDYGPFGNSYLSCQAAGNNASYGTPSGFSAAQRTKVTADWAGLSDSLAGSYVIVGSSSATVLVACYAEGGGGEKAETAVATIIVGGNLASASSHTTSSIGPRYNGAQILNAYDFWPAANGGGTATVNGDLTVSNQAGNANLLINASGIAWLRLAPGGVVANGLDLQAGSGGAYFGAGLFQFRNAAGSTNYFTHDGSNFTVQTGSLKVSGGSIGYATGAGGAVTQATSKSTGVTLNKVSGQITMNGAALAAGAKVSFVVTNSTVAATDVVIVSVASGGTANAYRAAITAVAAGSFTVTVENITAGSLSEAPTLSFAVMKAVAA